MRFIASAVLGGGRAQWSVTIKGDDSTLLSLLDEGMCDCYECTDGGEPGTLGQRVDHQPPHRPPRPLPTKERKNMLKASSEVKATHA